MSAYKAIQTKMTELWILTRALEDVKPEWKGNIQTAKEGKPVSIHGDTTMDGELVIKRDKAGTYSDIGVVRTKEGTFEMKISDVDNGTYFKDSATRAKQGKLFDQGFVDRVQSSYSLIEGVWKAQNAGAKAVSEKVALSNVPGLTGKVMGVRMAMPRDRAMQLV